MNTKRPITSPPKPDWKKSKHNDQTSYLICNKIIIEQDENSVGEEQSSVREPAKNGSTEHVSD